MNAQELQTLLTERAEKFHLKNEAFHTLYKILSEDPEELIGGFARHEITFVFEGYQYLIEQRYREPIIRARISLCVEKETYVENLEPIGYYDLEMDFDGEIEGKIPERYWNHILFSGYEQKDASSIFT